MTQPVKVEKVNLPKSLKEQNKPADIKENDDEIAKVNKLLKKSVIVRNSYKSKKNKSLLESTKSTKEKSKPTVNQGNYQKKEKSKRNIVEEVDAYLNPCDFVEKAQLPTELFKYDKFLSSLKSNDVFKHENLYCPPCNAEKEFIELLHDNNNTSRKMLHSNAIKTAHHISKTSSEMSNILLFELERFASDKTLIGQFRMKLVLENVIQSLEKLQIKFKELINSDIIIDNLESVSYYQSSILNLNVVCPSVYEASKIIENVANIKSLEFLNKLDKDTSKNILEIVENILKTNFELNNELVNAFKTVFDLLTNKFTSNLAILTDF